MNVDPTLKPKYQKNGHSSKDGDAADAGKSCISLQARGESPEPGGFECGSHPEQTTSRQLPSTRPGPPHGQALPRLMHCVRGTFAQSPWQMECTLGMASRGAEEAEVLKPKEPGGPEAVGLREHLRGSGMGPSPHISRTVMLRKYRTYSVWFHRWNQAR